MNLSANIIYFHDAFGLKKTIDIFQWAGFGGIDFNADLREFYTDTHDRAYYQEMQAYAQARGIVFSQAHAPFGSSYPDEARTRLRFEEIVTAIRHAAWIGAKMIVVHPCVKLPGDDQSSERQAEYNLDFYRRLIPYAKEENIRIAIENIPNTITETVDGLISLFDALHDPVFTVCFDVGHAHFTGHDPAVMIHALGARIGCTHIHDNDGSGDQHRVPFYGTVDWEGVMRALAAIGYAGDLSYEANTIVEGLPSAIWPESAQYLERIGRYLIDRFEYYRQNA